ncbi:MAG: hypothetical protein ACI83I_002559 [Bacteroidia bacterium]|jgi:hypothetical protein
MLINLNQIKMKKQTLITWMWLAGLSLPFTPIFGQDGPNGTDFKDVDRRTHAEVFDDHFDLDPNRIPTGYLYNRVYPVAQIDSAGQCDTIYTMYSVFQPWLELETSAIKVDREPSYENLKKSSAIANLSHKIPIVIIDMNYAMFSDNSLEDGSIIEEDGIYRVVDGRNPYVVKNFGRAGFSTTELVEGRDNIFYFGDDQILSNTNRKVKSIRITPVDEPSFTITPNLPFTYVPTTAHVGVEYWDIEVDLEGPGPDLCNKQKVVIKERMYKHHETGHLGYSCKNGALWIIESDIPFMGYLEDTATNSIADAHVYYHTTPVNKCKLIKPVIITDGFDAQDLRPYFKIAESMNYSLEPNTNMVTQLQNLGFDVIILNFPIIGSSAIKHKSNVKQYKADGTFLRYKDEKNRDGGTDYIERNAFLLVKLIQEVNLELQKNESEEQLVVMGPSMGGMVSRYALAYMEQKEAEGVFGMDHNTRLWVSFDAPHQGANIPIGSQYALDYFAYNMGDDSVRVKFETKLRAIAGRQLLINQYESFWGPQSFRSQFHHSKFFADLKNVGLPNSDGFPTKLRKVSLINGVINGQNSFTPGSYDLFIEATKNGKDAFKLIHRYVGEMGTRVDVFEAMYRERINFIKSKPHSQMLPYTNLDVRGSMDCVQGGQYPDSKEVTNLLYAKFKEEEIKDEDITVHYADLDYTFIPSFSALNILNDSNMHWNTDISKWKIACNKLTNFDNVFAPDRNQFHMQLTNKSVDWLLEEIEKGKPGCSSFCAEEDDFPDNICAGITEDFSLKNLPSKGLSGITWYTTDGNLSLVGGQNTSNAKFKAQNNARGQKVDVYSLLHNSCGANQLISHTIRVPLNKFIVEGEAELCSGFVGTYTASANGPIQDVHWYFSDVNGSYYSASPYSNVTFPTNSNAFSHDLETTTTFSGSRFGNYNLQVEGTNYCSEEIEGTLPISIVPRSTCIKQKMDDEIAENVLIVSPNPSSSFWSLSIADQDDHQIGSVKMINMAGSVIFEQGEIDQATFDLDGSNFPTGMYYLWIETKQGNVYTRKLLKE